MIEAKPVADRYRRLELLGEGSAGQVWLVEDQLRPGSRLALKETAADAGERAQTLRREFVFLSRLRHPGLVEAYDLDFSPTDGNPRFTLEYVEGEDLAAATAHGGPGFFLEMAAEALRVLGYLHDFDLIHRDLKPANLIVRRQPRLGCRLVLLDLGLAIRREGHEKQPATGPVGTLPYMAPELFDGAAPGRHSDLYGIGALFHEVIHGQPPNTVRNNDLTGFVERVRAGRRSRPALPDGYPAGLAAWLEELLSPDPRLRPAGAREALARLNVACGRSFPLETPASRAARLASDPPPGRDRELAKLWSLLRPDHGPRVVWLTGPAGSGKSRALRWLRTEAILRDWFVASPPAYRPEADEQDSDRGHASLLTSLRSRAEAQPTLLLLDDLEMAGGPLVRCLDRIARNGKAPPVQVVAAVQPGEAAHPSLRRLLDDTGTVPTLDRLELGALEEQGIRSLAQRATGGSDLSEARLRWLLRASEGNPLMAEALLVDGAWEKGGTDKRSKIIERSVLARLNLLSPRARTWLETLAVLGAGAREPEAVELSELGEANSLEAADDVLVVGLADFREGLWSPTSRSVRDLVLRDIDADRRIALHRRAAELLEARQHGPASPWRLARLWSAAGEPALARDRAVEAARISEAEGDPAEAALRYAYALRHCAARSGERFELRRLQATALMSAGRYQASARAWGAALRMAPSPSDRADLLVRQADALVQAGRFSRARAAAREGEKLAEQLGLPRVRANALKASGMVQGRLGREAEALPLLDEALAVLHEQDDAETEAATLQIRAACKVRLQRGDAEQDFARAIELYRELDQPGAELKSLVGLAVIHMRRRCFTEARGLLDEVRHRAVEYGNLDLLEQALSKLASLSIEQGALDDALSLSHEALDHACHLGDHNRMMVNRCRLAETLILCGRPAEAAELMRGALKGALDKVEPDMADTARMLLAQALLETSSEEDEDVRILLDRSQQGFRRRRKVRPLLIALALEMERRAAPGHPEPFEPVRLEFEALAERGGLEHEGEIRLRADLARATYQLGRGDSSGAGEIATRAIELAGQANLPAYGARASGLLGKALEAAGNAAAANDAFASAADLLEEAAGCIKDSTVRHGFLDRPVFQVVRRRPRPGPGGDDRRLLALYEMIRALNSEPDPDALLESILDMALRAVSAERGMILLRQASGEAFTVRLVRNLEKETEQDAERYSSRIVEQAGAGESILALDAGEDDRFRDLKSVSMYGIRSLMCVPLRSHGRIIGTVYLDSRRDGTLFVQDDLRFVEAFADHAAVALHNVRERADLVSENRRLREVAETRVRFGNIVGRSPAMQRVFSLIEKVGPSHLPVLIQGDSGTGKELVARALHFHGDRRRKVFLSENCAAIPESLLESELFGHVKGAFTGADHDRAGLFEQADGGTLFLDEVGDMSPGMQARLLRALQEGEIRRVGGEGSIKVDVRVIAATNRDLVDEVQAGRFREDLLYRLRVLVIELPPLRERPEDISPLIDHLLARIARERGRDAPVVSQQVRDVLERYSWPGNVRQLENTLQRVVLLAGGGPVTLAELQSDAASREHLLEETPSTGVFSLDQGVRDQLVRALAAANGNRERAARLLGVSRATIYRKIKEFGL